MGFPVSAEMATMARTACSATLSVGYDDDDDDDVDFSKISLLFLLGFLVGSIRFLFICSYPLACPAGPLS